MSEPETREAWINAEPTWAQDPTDRGILLCSGCGETYTHTGTVEVWERDLEDSSSGTHVTVKGHDVAVDRNAESRNPSLRREGIRVTFACELCDTISVLRVVQHKGQTFVFYGPKGAGSDK